MTSRLYARCTKPLVETHGVAPGAACLLCEREYLGVVRDYEIYVKRLCDVPQLSEGREKPKAPRRTRLEDAPVYAALLRESKLQGLPLRFTTDLTDHDRWGLATWHAAGEQEGFVWVLRESGTQLIRAEARAPRRDRSTPADDVRSVASAFGGPLLWYCAQGTSSREIQPLQGVDAACEWLRVVCEAMRERAEEGTHGR